MPNVSYLDINQTFKVENNHILYDALKDQDCDLPHGCLAGSCGACRIEVIEGENSLTPASFIEVNTIESLKQEYKSKEIDLSQKNIRLACRAKVLGDLSFKTLK